MLSWPIISQYNLPKKYSTSSKKEIARQRAAAMPSLRAYYGLSSFYWQPINHSEIADNEFWTQLDNNKNQQLG